jgi:hypothetical protein
MTDKEFRGMAYIPPRNKKTPIHYGPIKTDRSGKKYVEEIDTPNRMGSNARLMISKVIPGKSRKTKKRPSGSKPVSPSSLVGRARKARKNVGGGHRGRLKKSKKSNPGINIKRGGKVK